MKKFKYTKLIFIICSLLVAILIFGFSAQINEANKEEIRILAHFAEFAALSFCISLGIWNNEKKLRSCGIATLISAIFAGLIELYPTFSEGLSCELRDVIIDLAGAICGAFGCFVLFWAMKQKWFKQVKNFLLVGFSVFLIDYILLYILTDIAKIWYLLSATISFIVSTIYNYFMSMRFVFKSRDDRSKKNEFTIFFILNLIGLGINTLCMYVFVSKLEMYYMIAKILVTGIVMVWSFISRKIFIEKH